MRATGIPRMSALLLAVVLVAVACGSGNGFGGETATITPAVVSTQDGDLLRTVQDRGRLVCGVSGTRVIFSETQPDGSVVGVDADYCRVVAAAVHGDLISIPAASAASAMFCSVVVPTRAHTTAPEGVAHHGGVACPRVCCWFPPIVESTMLPT